jgi:hypothetical protein
MEEVAVVVEWGLHSALVSLSTGRSSRRQRRSWGTLIHMEEAQDNARALGFNGGR